MSSAGVALSGPSRLDRLRAELQVALDGVERAELEAWGSRSTRRFVGLSLRRVRRFAARAGWLVRTSWSEGSAAIAAVRKGDLRDHLRRRAGAARSAMAGGLQSAIHTAEMLAREPGEAAPLLLGAGAGFLLGSGGLDADGGIPDLDLVVKIGQHRSIFTHSVLPAVVIEGLLLALLELVSIVHARLPAAHDPFWDACRAHASRFATGLAGGIGIGIAYHLAIDATFDGMTPYKDLPLSLPMDGHVAILGANAAAEAAVVRGRTASHRSRPGLGVTRP